MSFLRQASVTAADARAAEYVFTFGPPVDVHVNGGIDVFVHPPRRGLPEFSTLVTSGMSDTLMDDLRAELVLYARRPAPDHVALMRAVAAIPVKTGRRLRQDDVVTLGAHSVLLAPSPLTERIESPYEEPIVFLWPVPLEESDVQFLAGHGHAALVDRLYGDGSLPACLLVDGPRTTGE